VIDVWNTLPTTSRACDSICRPCSDVSGTGRSRYVDSRN
jgi:hypothetical protein